MDVLHRAIIGGRLGEVMYLLERKDIDPNIRDTNLRTPLIACSLNADEDVAVACAVKLLCKGAEIRLSDRLGRNALCWACTKNKSKLTKVFLKDYPTPFKFDLLKQDRDGNTALHLAARAGDPDLVKHLIETYMNNDLHTELSGRNNRGETPLGIAAKRGNSGAVLALLPVSSRDILSNRRGAVDFRSAPRWASAAVRVSQRPFSVQPVTSSTPFNTLNARQKRPKTVTAISSNLTRFSDAGNAVSVPSRSTATSGKMPVIPSHVGISQVFKISEIQLTPSSAYRRPAKKPTLPTPPSVGDDEKKRSRSSLQKQAGKGRRGSAFSSRSTPVSRRPSLTDGDVSQKQQPKYKAVPTVVIDKTGDKLSNSSGRKDSGPGKLVSRNSLFNLSMSDIPESPDLAKRAFLSPFDGSGMGFEFASRASSLHSVASDVPGPVTHNPPFSRCETAPLIALVGNPHPQIRRTKSEPSLSILGWSTEPTVADKTTGSRSPYKRSRGMTHRRRGHVPKTRPGEREHAGKRHHGKPTSIKLAGDNHVAVHAGDVSSPLAPATSSPPSRVSRRFFRSGREAEVTAHRRRTELEKRIRCLQSDIARLERRRQGRKYKSLIPDWVTVDDGTTVEEVVSAILKEQSSSLAQGKATVKQNTSKIPNTSKEAGGSTLQHTRELKRYNSSASTSSDVDHDQQQGRSITGACSPDLDAEMQDESHPSRTSTTIHKSKDRNGPRLLQDNLHGNATSVRIGQPARAPVYKQSRSVLSNYKHQSRSHHPAGCYSEEHMQVRAPTMPGQRSSHSHQAPKPGSAIAHP